MNCSSSICFCTACLLKARSDRCTKLHINLAAWTKREPGYVSLYNSARERVRVWLYQTARERGRVSLQKIARERVRGSFYKLARERVRESLCKSAREQVRASYSAKQHESVDHSTRHQENEDELVYDSTRQAGKEFVSTYNYTYVSLYKTAGNEFTTSISGVYRKTTKYQAHT